MEQQHNTNRLYHSLPALDIEILPELRHHVKKRKWRRPGDEALTYIVSAFYAKTLVILGLALPVTDAIACKDYDSYDVYYVYLYIGSILFLFYMFIIQLKEKSFHDSWRYSSNQRQSTESNESLYQNKRRNQYNRYGSFYFRMGVTGFGIGSVIYSGMQFGQYFELSSTEECKNIIKAAKPFLKTVFALMQMLFIFSYSNFLDVQKSKIIARFGLMHMIATNLCEWLFILVQETQHDIYRSARMLKLDAAFLKSHTFEITQQLYERNNRCLRSRVMKSILSKLETYLAPCNVEYSLLCAVILALMWKNNCGYDDEENEIVSSTDGGGKQSRSNVTCNKNLSTFSVDCAQAHKGLFSGILFNAVTIVSLIMFFELVSYKEYEEAAIFQVNVWEAVLFWTGTLAVIFCIVALRDVGFSRMKRNLELEHLLLLVTQCGVFIYFLFQIIGAVLMGPNNGKEGIMRIITPLSALVQSSCQTVLVLDTWQRRCTSQDQMRRKPGRQWITFLLVINIALWVVNRLKNNRSFSHPKQMSFYGVLAWNIITHVSMPLVVSYRFQSTVCFYEIWKHVYKMRPIKRESNEFKNDLQL